MYVLMCMRVPRYTHARAFRRALEEEECVFLLYIHHLSLLRSHRPSCRTLLSYCIFPTFHPGLLFCHHPSPTLSNVALWLLLPWLTEARRVQHSVSRRLLFGGNSGCFIPQEHNVGKSNYIANVLHNTMPLFHRASGLCQVSHTHIKNTSVHKRNHLFFLCCKTVHYPFPQPPCIYEDLTGCLVEAVLCCFLAYCHTKAVCLSPFISW